MFCANCGNSLKSGSKFCGVCGTPVEPVSAPAASVPVHNPIPAAPRPKSANETTKVPMSMVVVILCVLGVGFGVGGFFILQLFFDFSPSPAGTSAPYQAALVDRTYVEDETIQPGPAAGINRESFEISTLENFLAEHRTLFVDFWGDDSFFDFNTGGFVDPMTGAAITQSPYIQDGAVMDSYTLYDFNNDGVPEVVIRWVWPETGGGFPHDIYQYVGGAYSLVAVLTSPDFYRTEDGQIIAFEWNYGELRVSRLLPDESPGVEIIVNWGEFHHYDVDRNNPALFNLFDGSLTPIAPLHTLQQSIHGNITERLRAEGRIPAPAAGRAAMPFPGSPIGPGSENTDAILFIQNSLNYINRYFSSVRVIESVGGVFGAGTQGAVIDFQRRMGLPATGIVDQITWQHISDVIENPPGLPDPPFFPRLNAYYRTLSNLHLRSGPSTDTESLDIVPEGTFVWAMDFLQDEGWFWVISHDGQHGFMSAQFLVLDD